MQLSRLERLMLHNQFAILGKLYPDEERFYEELCEVLRHGYELHYPVMFEHIYEETMSHEECEEVVDTLSMFRVLKYSIRDMAEKPDVEDWQVTFGGYDGNFESTQMLYAKFFCEHDRGRFEELGINNFNSHSRMRESYARMRDVWSQSRDKNELTKEDVERIAAAASSRPI